MPELFEPGYIGRMRLKNRILMSPLHMCFTMEQENAFLIERAKGGAASVTAVLAVSDQGAPQGMNWMNEEVREKLRELAREVRTYDCRSIVQLFHCGRNCLPGRLAREGASPLAPSAVPSPLYKNMPRAMNREDIQEAIRQFADAAAACREAGIDCVEVSCSAGYLLNEFLAPHTNRRTDEYGGSMENRMGFPLEVLAAVREAVGQDYPVMVRLSGDSMVEGGYGLEDMKVFAARAEKYADAFNVTGGWHESRIPQISQDVEPGSFAYLARGIHEAVHVPTVACNRINSRESAEAVLAAGGCEFVGCGRAFVADPAFGSKIRAGLPYQECTACNVCLKQILFNKPARCAVNPAVGREYLQRV